MASTTHTTIGSITLTGDRFSPMTTDRRGPWRRLTRLHFLLVAAAASLVVVACSSTEAAEPDDGERRRNQIVALGISNSPIPAGRWGAEINGHDVEIAPEQNLETVSFNYGDSGRPPELLIFDSIPQDDRSGFFVVPFEGFVDAVDMRTPDSDNPLTADEFIDGLSQAMSVTNVATSSIGGQASVTWQFGPQDPNSAFACDSDDRNDLADDDLCTRWGAAGERTVDFASESVVWNYHYVASAGMAVVWAYADTGAGDPFAALADSLLIDS